MPIRWQCPVSLLSRCHTAKSDVYSFGVLLWEIFSDGSTPYGDLLASEVLNAVRAGHRLARPSPLTAESITTLIWRCTVIANLAERPTMTTVRQQLHEALAVHAGVPLDTLPCLRQSSRSSLPLLEETVTPVDSSTDTLDTSRLTLLSLHVPEEDGEHEESHL